MPSAVVLPTIAEQALPKFSTSEGLKPDHAAGLIIMEWLIANGYMALPDEIDEHTSTEGNA